MGWRDADGIRIVFDPAIDGGAWPGPLGEGRRACLGEAWVGPLGLISLLETRLGLEGRVPSETARVVELARRLAEMDGYWRRSFEVDRLGTARRLLRDRDALTLWGWRGEAVSKRLADLAAATVDARPGPVDRLIAIVRALGRRRVDVSEVRVCSPEETMATAWRELFAELRRQGVTVTESVPEPAVAHGDLARARDPEFEPTGDGRLSLLRTHGALAAAEEVAGSLAAMDSLDGVVLVGADVILRQALVRHGLPAPRVRGDEPASVAAVRLVLEAMFEPADPADVFALACLEPGPIPPAIGRRLANALAEMPGRRSPHWRSALDEGLGAIDDEKRRDVVRQRVETLLEPATRRSETAEVSEVQRRLDAVASWARGARDEVPSVTRVAMAANALSQLLSELGLEQVERQELRRLAGEIDEIDAPVYEGQAGLATVGRPGAVLGPARVVIWWGFTRDAAPALPRVGLTRAEAAAFEERGVAVPETAALARGAALRWRRPLEQATDALLLACPRTTGTGEAAHPHPLWDEVAAMMAEPRHAARLEVRQLRLPAAAHRRAVDAYPRPVSAPHVNVSGPIGLRENGESPSSLGKLLGCSFRWALEYHGRVRRRLSAVPRPGPLLFGKLAHHVLAEVFQYGELAPEEAAVRARAMVERDLPGLCESLFLPRFQAERAELEQVLVASARTLAWLIQTAGARIRGTEVPLERDCGDLRLTGTADLILEEPDVVIDLKWSKSRYRDALAVGTALQLAAYRAMLAAGAGDSPPEVAYFALRSQELLAEVGTSLSHAETPGAVAASDTWTGAMNALADRVGELARGELAAPGADGQAPESSLDEGHLTVEPGCRYCELDVLCGSGGTS